MKTLINTLKLGNASMTFRMNTLCLINDFKSFVDNYTFIDCPSNDKFFMDIGKIYVNFFIMDNIYKAHDNFSKERLSDSVYFEDLSFEQKNLLLELVKASLIFWHGGLMFYDRFIQMYSKFGMTFNKNWVAWLVTWFYNIEIINELFFLCDAPKIANLKSSEEYIDDIFDYLFSIWFQKDGFMLFVLARHWGEHVKLDSYDDNFDQRPFIKKFYTPYLLRYPNHVLAFLYNSLVSENIDYIDKEKLDVYLSSIKFKTK